MKFRPTELPDVIVVEPLVHRDDRGFFLEVYHEGKFREAGLDVRFVQDNHSRSARHVLRGLHAQLRRPQGKLVRATVGEIYDVAVDVRPGSPTFGRWVGVLLSGETLHACWVPPGFAHGFCVLSDVAEIEYKCTAPYDPTDEIVLRWDDPTVGVRWPVADPVLSARDRAASSLKELEPHLVEAARGVR